MKIALTLQTLQRKIYLIRGHKVMLDRDLAELYGVETFNLNKAVKRNYGRFPSDFMFQLTRAEFKILIFQFGISSWGGNRKLPFVFTEQGVAMLSSVLRSERAVQVNIQIMRTFTRLREMISSNKELARKLVELEKKVGNHDQHIALLFTAIRKLMDPPPGKGKRIGFSAN